jgi:hypothetical protein
MRTIMRSTLAGASGAFLLLAAPALAQPFPGGKPIEMTVMFGAGSAADVTARYLADGMAKTLGVPVPAPSAIAMSSSRNPMATPSSGTRTRSRRRSIPACCRSITRPSTPWPV